MRNRTLASLIAGALGLAGIAATAAVAYTGSAPGKKLASEMLASYKHVHYLSGAQHGSVFYCASLPEGVYLGAKTSGANACATPAHDAWVATLARGNGVSAVGTVTAPGKPAIHWASSSKGTFTRIGSASCWHKSSPDPSYVGSPPFGFFSTEHLTVAGRSGPNVLLVGTASHFKETDTISSKTHEIVGEDIHFAIGQPQAWTLITSYHNVSKAAAIPKTTPVC
jgi:hypothetical protein